MGRPTCASSISLAAIWAASMWTSGGASAVSGTRSRLGSLHRRKKLKLCQHEHAHAPKTREQNVIADGRHVQRLQAPVVRDRP